MSWYLTLQIDAGIVDAISIGYANTQEAQVLEEVFPKIHWVMENPGADENPPEFDFVRNAERTAKAIESYRERAKSYNGDAHYAPIPCWDVEFMKTYHVGEALQKLGLRPRLSIG